MSGLQAMMRAGRVTFVHRRSRRSIGGVRVAKARALSTLGMCAGRVGTTRGPRPRFEAAGGGGGVLPQQGAPLLGEWCCAPRGDVQEKANVPASHPGPVECARGGGP